VGCSHFEFSRLRGSKVDGTLRLQARL